MVVIQNQNLLSNKIIVLKLALCYNELVKKESLKNINTFSIKIQKEKRGYSAIVLGIDDVCVSQGNSYEDVLKNIQEALELYVEHLKLHKSKIIKSNIILMPIYA